MQGGELPSTHIKINERLNKDGFKMIAPIARDDKSFHATGIKQNGKLIYNDDGSRTSYSGSSQRERPELFTDALNGVFCPDCGAQGFRTDHPEIAVCGDYAGWFFYYIDEVDEDQSDTEVIIEGGELKAKPKKKAERKEY